MEPQYWRHFMELAAAGKGLRPLLQLLVEIAGRPAVICDLTLRILASQVPPGGPPLSLDDYLPVELPWEPVGEELYPGHLRAGEGTSFLMVPVGEVYRYGYLFLLETDAAWQNYRELLQAASLAAMIEMSRTRLAQETERRYRNEFIQDILYNNLPNREALVNRGRLWGWDFTRPHFLLVFALDGEMDENLWERWRQLMQYHIKQQVPEVILADRSDQLIVLVPVPATGAGVNKGKIARLVKSLQKVTALHLQGRTFSAGVGRFYENVADLYRAYQEAKVALEISHLMHRRGVLSFFDELGVLRLIFNQGEQELADYYEENLGLIVKYDREHNTDLLATLTAFFHASGDHNRAAEDMFIHVNTLRYRLKKVEELLGQDLRRLDVLVNLYTALQVKVLLGK
ncbi:helix-turn-helix domain-containing protein [Moorella naiadis]|uniref:PucR family transcriptional regulator n=1 Tax=Moorella naiadis (nom. illeg.) TaxID=3093670 RepID=UPI003D9C9537